MQTTKRTVRCSARNLTQEQALESLYDHPQFDTATMRVTSIRPDGEYWLATIKEKVSEFPPAAKEDEGGEESAPEPKSDEPPAGPPVDDAGDDEGDEESSDGPPVPGEKADKPGGDKPGGDKKPGGEKAEIGQLLHLVQQICDKLGIVGDPAGLPGAMDGAMPGPDSPPGDLDAPPAPPHGGPHGAPPAGGPAGPGGPVPPKPKLRPGETPPGVTPIGSPAFASVEAGTAPVAPGPMAQQGAPGAGVPCPTCGGPTVNGSCPTCQGGGNMGNPIVGKVASFTASEVTDLSIKQAKAELESLYGPQGYKVKQIREARNDANQRVLHALLSVR